MSPISTRTSRFIPRMLAVHMPGLLVLYDGCRACDPTETNSISGGSVLQFVRASPQLRTSAMGGKPLGMAARARPILGDKMRLPPPQARRDARDVS